MCFYKVTATTEFYTFGHTLSLHDALPIYHRGGAGGVFTGDRGASVRAMAEAFENWIVRQQGIRGIISAAGSGGTAMVKPAMRRMPIGLPKVLISTVDSGNVGPDVGPSDILMMSSMIGRASCGVWVCQYM